MRSDMNLNIKLNKYRSRLSEEILDHGYDDDDTLAPVMPAIDAVQQLIEQEGQHKSPINKRRQMKNGAPQNNEPKPGTSKQYIEEVKATEIAAPTKPPNPSCPTQQSADREQLRQISEPQSLPRLKLNPIIKEEEPKDIVEQPINSESKATNSRHVEAFEEDEDEEDEDSSISFNNPLNNFTNPSERQKKDEYEFIPKSVTLDVYSNDPEVKRFLKQLPRICNESGYNDQDYKCYSCRRPIGLIFGQSKLCYFDGHHYCSECHLGEKSVIPARILCNWDFNKYPVSKRNQHFLNLILNESMFELKKISPLLYKVSPELREIEELRRQAFFVRSYCTTCVQESISFELTKLIWPREHLVKQTDLYSLEDLVQIKSGALKQVLKNVITFGRQHVLSCVLCCQKGFICELCKSSQIIYPFDTESVHQCNECQSIYHKSCFKSKQSHDPCPRCQRLKARRNDN